MRTTASLAPLPTWAAPAAALVGEQRACLDAARLLSGAGFAIRSKPAPGAVVVLAGQARDDVRLRAARTVGEAHPDARILAVLPSGVPNTALRRVLLAGVTGIVFEDELDRALVPTAHALLAGQLAVPVVLGQQLAPRPLSHREKQILSLLVLGMTNREIADKLFLAESTVKTHLSSAFRKIDAHSRSEAVARIQDPESGIGLGVLAVTTPRSA